MWCFNICTLRNSVCSLCIIFVCMNWMYSYSVPDMRGDPLSYECQCQGILLGHPSPAWNRRTRFGNREDTTQCGNARDGWTILPNQQVSSAKYSSLLGSVYSGY